METSITYARGLLHGVRRYIREHGERSLHEEIIRVRLEHARELLAATDLPMSQIVSRAGITHVEYLNVMFRKNLGESPGAFRKRRRSTDAVD